MSPFLSILPQGEFKFSVEELFPNTLFEVSGKLQIFPSTMGTLGCFWWLCKASGRFSTSQRLLSAS